MALAIIVGSITGIIVVITGILHNWSMLRIAVVTAVASPSIFLIITLTTKLVVNLCTQ